MQKIYKYLTFLLAGALLVGALFDAVSNSISLITFPIALGGTILILGGYLLVEIIARIKGIKWLLPGGANIVIRKLNNQIKLFLAGVIMILWLPFLLKSLQKDNIVKPPDRIHRNVHDLSLYLTHYFNSLLDSSNPKYFELKIKQIDTIQNELEKHLEFFGIDDKIRIPIDTLESRYLLLDMIDFEKNEIKPKIRINFGESHLTIYNLSRNMWQYEYFFNIFQKREDDNTREILIKLRNNITSLSGKVDFELDERKLSAFLYSPTTELIDDIILSNK